MQKETRRNSAAGSTKPNPPRTLPREDPSIGETTPSANQRAYAEDAKQLIR